MTITDNELAEKILSQSVERLKELVQSAIENKEHEGIIKTLQAAIDLKEYCLEKYPDLVRRF